MSAKPWDFPTQADLDADSNAGIRTRWVLWRPRWERFLALGGALQRVYNEERDAKRAAYPGRYSEKRNGVPPRWRENAERWGWRDRHAAYVASKTAEMAAEREVRDSNERNDRRAKDDAMRLEARVARRKLLTAAQSLLAKTMNPHLKKDASPLDVDALHKLITTVERLNRDLRQEFSDMPTQKVDALVDVEYDVILTMRDRSGHNEDGDGDYGEALGGLPATEEVFDYTDGVQHGNGHGSE